MALSIIPDDIQRYVGEFRDLSSLFLEADLYESMRDTFKNRLVRDMRSYEGRPEDVYMKYVFELDRVDFLELCIRLQDSSDIDDTYLYIMRAAVVEDEYPIEVIDWLAYRLSPLVFRDIGLQDYGGIESTLLVESRNLFSLFMLSIPSVILEWYKRQLPIDDNLYIAWSIMNLSQRVIPSHTIALARAVIDILTLDDLEYINRHLKRIGYHHHPLVPTNPISKTPTSRYILTMIDHAICYARRPEDIEYLDEVFNSIHQ